MRALSVEVKNLSTEIGEVLLPIITPIITRIKEFVSGLRELSPEMLRIGVVIAGVVCGNRTTLGNDRKGIANVTADKSCNCRIKWSS